MVFIEMLFALAVALFLTVVFAVIGRQAKTPRRVILFFVIVFLGAWAGGIWLTPVGPALLGVYWLSFFAVGLIFALVMEAFAAFSKHPSQQGKAEVQEDVEEERELESIIWTFFWILIAAFAGVIVLGYLRRLRS
jgi:heme/copper-type cytochrome/quinol oxidase subunit 2